MSFKYIYWYKLFYGFKDYLKNFTYENGNHLFEYIHDYENLKISDGTWTSGQYPAIVLHFSDETDMSEFQKDSGGSIVQLWVDIYLGNIVDSSLDNPFYNEMFKIETEIFNNLGRYKKVMCNTLGMALNIKVRGILSDGDENLPTSMWHRMVIDLDWRKN